MPTSLKERRILVSYNLLALFLAVGLLGTPVAKGEAPANPIDALPPQTQVDENPPELDSILVIYVDPTNELDINGYDVSFAPSVKCREAGNGDKTWGHFSMTLELWSKDGSESVHYRHRYTTDCMPAAPVSRFSIGWFAVSPDYFGHN